MTPTVWTERFRVRAYEIDPDARLTVPTLCDWLQEAAGNHATALGVATDTLMESGHAWVLSRLNLEIDRLPQWRDEVLIETWPAAENGLIAERDFLIRTPGGDQLARASSNWVIIDVERRRPVRLPPAVVELELPHRERALSVSRSQPASPNEIAESRTFSVRRSDLDLNRHVNNARFVAWALEAVPAEILEAYRLTALDVQFRSESVYGDTIVTATGETRTRGAQMSINHVVSREDSLLAVLESQWLPVEPQPD